MIRVAALQKQLRTHRGYRSPDGLTPDQQLLQVRARALRMLDEQAKCWNEALWPELAAEGIRFLEPHEYAVRGSRFAVRAIRSSGASEA